MKQQQRPNFWVSTKHSLTFGELQQEIARRGLNRLKIEVNRERLGEITISYVKPKLHQVHLKRQVREFRQWLCHNKPANLTVRYDEVG